MRSLQNMKMTQIREPENDEDLNDPRIPLPLGDGHKEWSYLMRRTMQQIVPGLFLGPYSSASRSKLNELLELGITHIVCIRQNIEANFIKPNFPDKFKYLVLDIADSATENIIQHFQTVKNFIDEGLNSEGRVLVHGNGGISRSAALVLAYIMQTYDLSHDRAYAQLQQRRFCISPNEGFMRQLWEFEPIYKAMRTQGGNNNADRQCTKRTIHQIENDRVDDVSEAMES